MIRGIEGPPIAISGRSPRSVLRRLWQADSRARIGLLVLAVLLALALAAPAMHDPTAQDAKARLLPPSWEHPFGTDEIRRDIFSRTFNGLRSSIQVSVLAVLLGAGAGIFAGFAVGYVGHTFDVVLMRVVDAWLAFPGLLAAIAVLTVIGPGMRGVSIALLLFNMPAFIRMARAQALAERDRDYVLAARSLGAPPIRIVVRHIAINAMPPLLTQLSIALAAAILIAAALSFLGMGERPPAPSLGGMINAARPHLGDAWWYVAFPSGVLSLFLLSLTMLSDAINDHLGAGRR